MAQLVAENSIFTYRRRLLWLLLLLAFAGLLLRAYDLQVLRRDFLNLQANSRQQRVVEIPARRGMITDRYGEPLAISAPVESIWVNPQQLADQPEAIRALAQNLQLNPTALQRRLDEERQREFLYIKRQLPPAAAQAVLALDLPGVFSQREYRRYYPAAEVTAHILGFTDVDDQGQEGVELVYNDLLQAHPGRKRIVQDRLGRVVADVEQLEPAQPGETLRLSIDKRLQYLAYRALKAAVQKHQAKSGSVIMLDSHSGEILAMVNQPTFNPNNRNTLRGENYRNRVVTDMFEPGSTIKPFTVAAALAEQRITPTTRFNTNPGYMRIANYTIRDIKNHGELDVTDILKFSSNIGATQIALTLEPEALWQHFHNFGFGSSTLSGLPGEVTGQLNHFAYWHGIEQATIGYGYGIATTALQLANAYAILANDGRSHPVSLVPVQTAVQEQRVVIPAKIAQTTRTMLAAVVASGGTGWRAQVPGYELMGKTGTVRKITAAGYSEQDYTALFAGFGPAYDPRLVVVVMIDQPQSDQYYGGQVAAPVFAELMQGALRLLDIPPDKPQELYPQSIARAGI